MLMRWDVINALLGRAGPHASFLEIGVASGECGRRVRAALKIGVDPAPQAGAESYYSALFRVKSDDFFRDARWRFDVVLIDGLHVADQVLRDARNSMRVLAPGGVIVMHDCNPATLERERPQRNGDCWKALVEIRRRVGGWRAFVIDSDQGLGIVRRCRRKRPPDLAIKKSMRDLQYSDLAADRKKLLNLVNAEGWSAHVR